MVDLLHYWRKVRTLPPQVVLQKAGNKLRSLINDKSARSRDKLRPSFLLGYKSSLPLVIRLGGQYIPGVDEGGAATLALLCNYYLEHRFDLLGSGWVQLRRGMACRGLEGHRYQSSCPSQPEHDFLDTANFNEARRIRTLIPETYQPIDWHLDFKSGYRWEPKTWYRDVPYGHLPGVDVKVPWELARMQHLPQLAQAYACARHEMVGFANPEKYADEFRNQVLDFVAANPPRFGVNWGCTMDVAIRAANWLLAYDLFRAGGAEFDEAFEFIFRRSVREHGQHIVTNLEWSPELRGNHYLADIAGLVFVASYLPSEPVVDAWLAFSVQELIAETLSQFNVDGSNFEGSTAYHGLSVEMAVYASALVLGLPERKRQGLGSYDHRLFKSGPGLKQKPLDLHTIPGSIEKSPFPPVFWQRLVGMARFTAAVTRPDGLIAQFGDNDSGRFFKLCSSIELLSVAAARQRYNNLQGYDELPDQAIYPLELHLDHGHVIAAVRGIVEIPAAMVKFGTEGVTREAAIVSMLAKGHTAKGLAQIAPFVQFKNNSTSPMNATAHERQFSANGVDILAGLVAIDFPDFGLYVWRGDNLYLAIRCGALGQNGWGGHSHNDQLGIELWIGGKPLVVDPGTYLYTPCVELRNAYRSVKAHYAPQFADGCEPGSLSLGTFSLGNEAQAVCLCFQDRVFVGQHVGYGFLVYRQIKIEREAVKVVDWHDGVGELRDYQPRPYSTSYGWSEQLSVNNNGVI